MILCCSVSVCQPDAGDGLDSDGFEQRESLQRTLCQAFQEAALMRGGTLIGSLGHQFSVMFGYPRSTEGDARLAASMAVEVPCTVRSAASASASSTDVPMRRSSPYRASSTIGVLMPFPKMIEMRNAVLMFRYLSASCASISDSSTPMNAGTPMTTSMPRRRKYR